MTSHRRIGLVHAALALLAIAVLARAAHVQLVEGRGWAEVARRQHFTAREVPAPRGRILDASGSVLATTREMVRLEIAPREVRDVRALRRALTSANVGDRWIARAADRSREWVSLPGTYVADDVAALTAMRGVYTTPVSERSYLMSPGLRPLIGHVARGRGADGLELTLDSLLSGTPGAARLVRDVRGRSFVSPTAPGVAPRRGHTITLTINQELQEIAERTLGAEVARMEAEGGDIVILDPRTGDVLALAGERHGRVAASATPVTEPFEPGSTLKPLIAAALLARGRARPTDRVPTLGGRYTLHGRTVHDEPHDGGSPPFLTLAEVIRYSSNVGIVQFADRLSPGEQFQSLRDFGLGTATGLPYSSEAGGTLRPPARWSRQSPASLAMGYELSVTPLQLALAYAAIANGGELLEPRLIREIRTADNELVFEARRRPVRRVISPRVAQTMRELLAGVVEGGTATKADLATYTLGGKTGTPRRTVRGKYAPTHYNPNFVGLFPADDPQLVVVVKLVSPRAGIYGGRTAAPMTKAIVEAALASRGAALDRSRLTFNGDGARKVLQSGTAPVASMARGKVPRPSIPGTMATAVVLSLPAEAPRKRVAVPRAVPDVRGLTLREAVRSLHNAGFRVQLASGSTPRGPTEPASGTLAAAGSFVRLRHSR